MTNHNQPHPTPKPSYEDLEAQVLEDELLIRGLRDRCGRLRAEIRRLGLVITALEGDLKPDRTDDPPPPPH